MFRWVVIGMAMFAILSFFGVAYMAWLEVLALPAASATAATKVMSKVEGRKKKVKRHDAIR